MNFDCKIEKITKDYIELRFFSEKKVELHLSHAKFFPIDDKDNIFPIPRLYLENNFKIARYSYPKREVKKFSVIVRDETYKENYQIIIHLDTENIEKNVKPY